MITRKHAFSTPIRSHSHIDVVAFVTHTHTHTHTAIFVIIFLGKRTHIHETIPNTVLAKRRAVKTIKEHTHTPTHPFNGPFSGVYPGEPVPER